MLTVTLPEKITSRTGPMSRRHVDETPLLHFQERTFSVFCFFCQTSLPSMPKHSPRAVNFFFLFPSRSLTASKPMSQLMQTGSRGVCVCVGWWWWWCWGNPLSQVESAEQSIDSSPTCIFILMAVDRCLAFSLQHFIIQHAHKKVHFLRPISL